MSEIPRGWMDAETARAHACRGVWAIRVPHLRDRAAVLDNAVDMASYVRDGDQVKFVGPHPGDEPAAGMVEIEAPRDPVALVRAALLAADSIDIGRGRANESSVQIAALLISAGFRAPTPEAVETVCGVSRE